MIKPPGVEFVEVTAGGGVRHNKCQLLLSVMKSEGEWRLGRSPDRLVTWYQGMLVPREQLL